MEDSGTKLHLKDWVRQLGREKNGVHGLSTYAMPGKGLGSLYTLSHWHLMLERLYYPHVTRFSGFPSSGLPSGECHRHDLQDLAKKAPACLFNLISHHLFAHSIHSKYEWTNPSLQGIQTLDPSCLYKSTFFACKTFMQLADVFSKLLLPSKRHSFTANLN